MTMACSSRFSTAHTRTAWTGLHAIHSRRGFSADRHRTAGYDGTPLPEYLATRHMKSGRRATTQMQRPAPPPRLPAPEARARNLRQWRSVFRLAWISQVICGWRDTHKTHLAASYTPALAPGLT